MNQVFKSFRRFASGLLLMFLGCGSPFVALAQPIATYISPPVVNSAPNVNATNFINSGTWNISVNNLLPYQTFSTYNYTNTGTMNSTIGWEFDHGPYPAGARDWSANFFNGTPGTISAFDSGGFANTNLVVSFSPSLLLISATNIVNMGTLAAGPYGLMQLKGSGVNLSRSALEITSLTGIGGSINTETNFIPDTAIYDEFWRGGTNDFAFGPMIWNGNTVAQGIFNNIGAPCGVTNASVGIGPLTPLVANSFTQNLNPGFLLTTNNQGVPNPPIPIYSNVVRQAIFVTVSDSRITPGAHFGQSIGISNIFRPMAVELFTTATNIATGVPETSTIYVVDNLAAVGTNGYLLRNTYFDPGAACQNPTYRPDSVIVSRSDDGTYANGSTGNGGRPTNTFFYLPKTMGATSYFSNATVIGRADVYSASVDNLAKPPPAGFSITNAPGRIEITARDLNLNKARITAAAAIVISASNLVSSAGATLDCQNLSFNVGSTNGFLNITNLAPQTVNRLNGTVTEWSGVWTNYQVDIYTNNWVTNAAAGGYTNSAVTNYVEMDLAITVVDAGGLRSTFPVSVLNLLMHSTNMVVSDYLTVNSKLLFDGQSLTINGGVTLSDPLVNWSSATAPTLRYFTNNGTLTIPQTANFGVGGATNYAAFVNNGSIDAGTETINSTLFLNSGSLTAAGGLFVTITSGLVQNSSIFSAQDVQFTAGTLKFSGSTVEADNQLYFAVTGSLFDSGGTSGNSFTCYNGFDLAIKPATGDLLGTALTTITPQFGAVNHYWSGLDLGPFPAGFNNNTAVGQLILNEGSGSEFIFSATTSSNAIYADLLDLSLCPDFLDPDVLTIDPNFVIYYAAVKLPPTFTVPPNTNGIAQQPEEYLNGQLGGHLRWVNSFAGPNSSVDVLINGQTAQVNKALRLSKIIDSNGNGIANYYDLNPFDAPPVVVSGAVVTNNPPPASKFAISWTAVAGAVYQVQYSTNLSPTIWTPLQNYTNYSPSSVVVTVYDTNAVAGRRFYRVSRP
ncbi:MAG: hypothetical protein WDM80_06310 [Limisphaerales bacterium]